MLLTSVLRGIDISVQGSLCREHDFASLPSCGGMRRGNAREREREKGERGSGEGWINEESERERASEREREIRATSRVGIIFTSAKITRIRADKS